MKFYLRSWLLLASTVLLPFAVHAQYGVAASFTAQHITLSSSGATERTAWVYGPTFSLQHEHGHFVKFGFDARGAFLSDNGIGVRAFDVGPRLAITPHVLPIKAYGEILIGGLGVRPTSTQDFTTHFDLQEAVGLDYTVIPHIDWRVLEYAHGNILGFTGLPSEDARNQLSTGIVVRFF